MVSKILVFLLCIFQLGFALGQLFDFASHTFTSAGATGPTGPNITALRSNYSSAAWASNSTFLTVVNGIQEWRVPVTGFYRLTCAGAAGGECVNLMKTRFVGTGF